MNRAICAAIVCLALLGGCEPKLWRDVSGKHRPDSVGYEDQEACQHQVMPSPMPNEIGSEQLGVFRAKLDACMATKGWQPISSLNSNWGTKHAET